MSYSALTLFNYLDQKPSNICLIIEMHLTMKTALLSGHYDPVRIS